MSLIAVASIATSIVAGPISVPSGTPGVCPTLPPLEVTQDDNPECPSPSVPTVPAKPPIVCPTAGHNIVCGYVDMAHLKGIVNFLDRNGNIVGSDINPMLGWPQTDANGVGIPNTDRCPPGATCNAQ